MKDMANSGEEERQSKAERNLFDGADKDGRAYRLVFDALRLETGFRLSPNFSEVVLQRMEANEDRKQYYWFVAVIISFMIAAGVSIVLTGFKPDFGFLKHISKFSGLFVFGTAFILFLQWVDKKVIQRNPLDIQE